MKNMNEIDNWIKEVYKESHIVEHINFKMLKSTTITIKEENNMPIYSYKCNICNHQLDKLQKISDAPLRECPQCKEEALTKQITSSSFQLKGTGWYQTDFKK